MGERGLGGWDITSSIGRVVSVDWVQKERWMQKDGVGVSWGPYPQMFLRVDFVIRVCMRGLGNFLK